MSQRPRCVPVVFAIGAAFLSGCGADPYDKGIVRGSVMTCKGVPATGGVVIFTPIDDFQTTRRPKGQPGRPARGTVEDDGSFRLTSDGFERSPGAVTGRHQVTFEMPPVRRYVLSAQDKALMTPKDVEEAEAKIDAMKVYSPIPCSPAINPSEVTVKPGENIFQFTLRSK
ncbi:MAG: hypothetical protein ACT4QC_17600 [Planctomycetaceae bacterium]